MSNKEKEFIKGYNYCIQNLSVVLNHSSYDFLAEAVQNSGLTRNEFEQVQEESGFQNEEMEEIFNMAFPTNN